MVKNFDLLICHPLKHHIFKICDALSSSSLNWRGVFPMYHDRKLLRLGWILPTKIRQQSEGYKSWRAEAKNIEVPLGPHLKRIAMGSTPDFITYYDNYIARLISLYRPKTIITMQDFMPATMAAARSNGIKTVSDQILNLSTDAQRRIENHCRAAGVAYTWHNNNPNEEIISGATGISYPSGYTWSGIEAHVTGNSLTAKIPYGSDNLVGSPSPGLDRYAAKLDGRVVAVRAPNVRKGGHLALRAIYEVAKKNNYRNQPKYSFIGGIDQALKALPEYQTLIQKGIAEEVTVPNSEIRSLLAKSSFFFMPTLSESMSLACLEAMSVGLPLLTTDYAGIDFISLTEIGTRITDEQASVTQGLNVMLDNPGTWVGYGSSASAAAKAVNWSRYVSEYRAFVQRIHETG